MGGQGNEDSFSDYTVLYAYTYAQWPERYKGTMAYLHSRNAILF